MREPRVIATGIGGISQTPRGKHNRRNVDSCGRCGGGVAAPRRGVTSYCKDCWWTDPNFCREGSGERGDVRPEPA